MLIGLLGVVNIIILILNFKTGFGPVIAIQYTAGLNKKILGMTHLISSICYDLANDARTAGTGINSFPASRLAGLPLHS